jgi:rare lipoprotein A
MMNALTRLPAMAALMLACCYSVQAATTAGAAPPAPARAHAPKQQQGTASIYSRKLARRPMADGTPLDPDSNAAAGKTLPLGTRAQVTNLRNGKSATVQIKDRGPYAGNRIIDLSPKTASELGFQWRGVAPVRVTPAPPGR